MEFFRNLFETDFMPHGHCYFWRPEILWPHVLGDGLTALAYFIIPYILYRFVQARPDLKYPRVFWAFSLFILGCGLTHALAVVSVWQPIYRMEAVAKVATAAISVITVGMLFRLYQPLLQVPTPEQLEQINHNLRREIKQREKTEQQLRIREQNFRASMEFAPGGMALLDLNGRWTKVNPALCRMLGYTEAELLGQDFQSVTHPDDLGQDLAAMEQMLSGEREGLFLQKRYVHKDGHLIWIMLGVALIRDEKGQPLHFVAQINDNSEQVENQLKTEAENVDLELKVRERTAQLEAINQELKEFSYAVSHDLRAPLRNLRGLFDVFKEMHPPDPDQDGDTIIQYMDSNIDRMDRLISHFLDFSRLGQQVLKKEDIQMEALFRQVFQEQVLDYKDKSVNLHLNPVPDIVADPILIRQVVENLISNALKYAAQGENIVINIRGWTETDTAVYEVQDNGVGFSPEAKHRLFKMFQRLHSEEQFAGHGIGLAFSHRIIQRHGGKMWAESTPGQGASFFFSLPV